MIVSNNLAKRIFKKAGAKRVSADARTKLGKLMEEFGLKIAKKSVEKSKFLGRGTVREEDVSG